MSQIQPFDISIAQSELNDLHDRLDRTRWPDEPTGLDWSYGTAPGYVRELAQYWRDGFDWRAQEARLNALPQHTTTIDGQTIHFVHATSPEPDATPLILTHGWPSTFADFAAMVPALTDPRSHGGDPADAFHVVIPSVPGFAFSGPSHDLGWNSQRVARAWAELMRRLGYERYGVQGSDFGAIVSPDLARLCPDRVVGMHLNAVANLPYVDPSELGELTDEDKRYFAGMESWEQISGYAMIQGTRPQTLAYALCDSPVGQLAWYGDWYAAHGDRPTGIDRDDVLTNVSLLWFTGTAGSAIRLYKENAADWGQTRQRLDLPVGMTFFAGEAISRRVAEREYHITHWTHHDHGGHFAALGAPGTLVADIRRFFRHTR